MDISVVDTRALLNAFPVPAMLLDEEHHVLDANMWMLRGTELEDDGCWFSCFNLLHHSGAPVQDCPLDEAARTKRTVQRRVRDDVNGELLVSVTPMDFEVRPGQPVYLHLLLPLSEEARSD